MSPRENDEEPDDGSEDEVPPCAQSKGRTQYQRRKLGKRKT